MRKFALTLALLFAVSCDDSTGPEPVQAGRLNYDPVLFVHGLNGSPDDFDAMRARFVADGWRDGIELFAFRYSSTVTNAANAQAIRNNVKYIIEKTGAKKVDIVSHEMGSLSSRFYIRHFGGLPYVDAWVSIGGPNHGTERAHARCTLIPCQEMDTESSFIEALNADVEGPPPARYATWRSPCDELVVPHESVAVWDAANYITACMPNASLIKEAAIYAQVREFVRLGRPVQ